jgi:sugar phosphate isomerase/epimerase
MTAPRERFSVSQLMLPASTFEDDVGLAADLRIGLGVSETKLGDGSDEELVELMRSAGVWSGVAVPAVIGPLKDAWRGGPDDPEQRVDAVCAAVDRLARFEPSTFLVVTGSRALYPRHVARRIVVDGLRRIAERAAINSMTVSVEVLRDEMNGSLYNDLPRTFELIDEVGADNVGVVFDVWHLWDAPDVLAELEQYARRIFAVQLADWRDPTRWNGDRVLPGDGVADFPALLGALERNGFTGVYDLEVFSDSSRPGSIWEGASAKDVLAASWQAFEQTWAEAGL